MAQLKSTVVLGDLRVTDSLTASTLTGSLAVANLVGIDTSNGSTSKCLTEKGTFASFGTSNLAIGSGSNQAMAGNTTVTNVAISANVTTSANYPIVFATSSKDTTTAVTEALQKSGAKFYFNPNSGDLHATTFNGITLTNTPNNFSIKGGSTSQKTLTINSSMTINSVNKYGIVYGSNTNSISSTTSGTSGQFLKSNGSGSAPTWADLPNSGVSLASQTTATIYLTGASSASATSLELSSATITTDGALTATTVHNAVWNDYAEYRRAAEPLKPGNVIIDNDDGTISLATQRLLPGAQVVSDTWGHIMGETDEAKTPVAVAGRVLVYTYQNRTNYHAGMAVCSAPNGTVDIMTREEIKEYPDCIIGYVSEIPNYETWGSGNVKVDGRIWVRVK